MPVRVKLQNVLHLNVKVELIKYILGVYCNPSLREYMQGELHDEVNKESRCQAYKSRVSAFFWLTGMYRTRYNQRICIKMGRNS